MSFITIDVIILTLIFARRSYALWIQWCWVMMQSIRV